MKKLVYILFMAFLFVSCGESHHQVTGFAVYKFDNPNEVFIADEFKRGDIDLVYEVFHDFHTFY